MDHTHTHKRSASTVEGLEEQRSTQKLKLDPAADLWSEDEHRGLDEEILRTYGTLPAESDFMEFGTAVASLVPKLLPMLHRQVVARATETDLALVGKQHTSDTSLYQDATLIGLTLRAWKKGSFKDIRNSILRPKASDTRMRLGNTSDSPQQQEATILSWQHEFQGTADEILFAVLKNYLHWTEAMKDEQGAPYANLAPIVNSSGTGKSRVVDQLGKKHCFVIPLCLRREGTDGYPPPDREVRDWLLKERPTVQGLNAAVVAFLRALFEKVNDRIKAILDQLQPGDSTEAHTIFARSMTEGGDFTTPPDYRRQLYVEVVDLATKNEATFTAQSKVLLESDKEVFNNGELLLQTCGDLMVVLSFDEAHELGAKPNMPRNSSPSIPSSGDLPPSNVPPLLARSGSSAAVTTSMESSSSEKSRNSTEGSTEGVTMFSQIRKGLRAVLKLKIVGLYLSTSGKYRLISPEPQHDPSSRLAKRQRVMFPPFTELGFNQLALPLNDPPTLTHVTTAEYISHLGRPIFATRWASGSGDLRDDLLGFALSKLAPDHADITINVLACLAARFAVEFRPRNERQEDIEHGLVENHMRYCIGADSHLRMMTTAPSEPLLAEAAFEYLQYVCHSPAWVLKIVSMNLDTWGIHQGDRGEFVMSLIWMAARDAVVVGRASSLLNRRPWDPSRHSVISIVDFMKKLVPIGFHPELEHMVPSVGDGTDKFLQAFEGCRLWCNHFIQVQDYKVINTRFLCALLSNGVGVLCAPNQTGIDLLWVGLKGDEIREDNLVLILGQAKNDRRYGTETASHILDAMNPIKLDICAGGHSVPIIRMVFALASRNPGVTLVRPPFRSSERKSKRSSFTSYDFWFAGVDPSTFGCVTDQEARRYLELLASSRILYNPPLPVSPLPDYKIMKIPEDLREETAEIGEARVNMRRAANSMRMALEPHFPHTWHDFLFKGKGNKREGEKD